MFCYVKYMHRAVCVYCGRKVLWVEFGLVHKSLPHMTPLQGLISCIVHVFTWGECLRRRVGYVEWSIEHCIDTGSNSVVVYLYMYM